MTSNTDNNFGPMLGSFLLGVASSSFVAWIVYERQRWEAEKFQRNLTLTLLTILKQGQDIDDKISKIESKIRDEENKSPNKTTYLIQEFNKTTKLLRGRFAKTQQESYIENVLKYKIIADEWSSLFIRNPTEKVIDKDGKILIENIYKLHKSIFPEGYTWAGQLRTELVKITSSTKISGRMIDPMLSSISIDVVRPEDIPANLKKLIEQWNLNVNSVIAYDLEAKCQELAYFHQEFLLIHPFIDGNGRVARMMTDDQASFLFNRDIQLNLKSDNEQYYKSLRLADLRQISSLSGLIKEKIKTYV